MKKIFLRRVVVLIVILCMCTVNIAYIPLSGEMTASAVAISATQTYVDENGDIRFQYYETDIDYVIQINIEELEWLCDSGILEEWYSEKGSIYVEIFVYRKGYVIPKEFINTMKRLNCMAYCFVKVGQEQYDWGLRVGTFWAKEDFSPYVTFSIPEQYADVYEENTRYVQLETRYNPYLSGFQGTISITSFCYEGRQYTTAEYFRDFFQRYSVDDIVEETNIGKHYSYRDYGSLIGKNRYPGEIGYFHISEFDADGKKKTSWKEDIWDYYVVGNGSTYATIEVWQLQTNLEGGTFVLSDAASIAEEQSLEPISSATPELTVSEEPAPTVSPDSTDAPAATKSPVPTQTTEPTTSPEPTMSDQSGVMTTNTPEPTQSPEPIMVVKQTPQPDKTISTPQTGRITNFTGAVTKDNNIKLKWSGDIPKEASKLVLYRKVSGGSSFNKIKILSLSKRKYTDKKAGKGKKYIYKLLCVDSTGKSMKSMKAISPAVSVPYFKAPKVKLSAVNQGGERYLKIRVGRYSGKYAEIYLSQDGKTYKKVPLKKLSIYRYHRQFLLRYQKSMGKVYCKIRTWENKKGKKRYSQYSAVKKIKLN